MYSSETGQALIIEESEYLRKHASHIQVSSKICVPFFFKFLEFLRFRVFFTVKKSNQKCILELSWILVILIYFIIYIFRTGSYLFCWVFHPLYSLTCFTSNLNQNTKISQKDRKYLYQPLPPNKNQLVNHLVIRND